MYRTVSQGLTRLADKLVKAVPNILSPAVRLGDTLYLSGQTPIDETGKVVEGDIEELTT
jgi:enamine deaminase RidA (YjgF/YER057c/UK114 family)